MKQSRTKISPADIHDIRLYHSDGWAALYINGELDTGAGEHYLCDERLYEILGVQLINDDAFTRGTGRHSAVCKTIEEIEQHQDERDRRRDEAAALRAQVGLLQGRIKELDPKG